MKKNIVIGIIAGIVVLFAAAALILSLESKNSIPAVLYYPDNEKFSLVWENENITFNDPVQIPNNIINKIQDKGGFPLECKVNTIDFDSTGRITVDFSEEFLTDKSHLNILQVYAIVKSICSTSSVLGISEVKVTVDSVPVTTTDGKKLGFLSESSINIMNSDEIMTYECELYFPDKEGVLHPEKREIDAANGNIEYNVTDALLDGPASRGLLKIFPDSVKLISAETSNGICYVNFSSIPKSADITLIRSALIYTLSSLKGIYSIQILSNGKILN